METLLIVFATSVLTAFFSNFLAPRLNANYERKYQDSKILKKTLRTLLEIELYIQRRLRHPGIRLLSEEMILTVQSHPEFDNKQLPALSSAIDKIFQSAQESAVSGLPDSDTLEKAFIDILAELSTVDPVLTYKISERHIINPIQRLDSILNESMGNLGITIKEEDVSKMNPFIEQIKAEWTDELLTDLRNDIKTVAAKVGRKMLKQIEDHYEEVELVRSNLVKDKVAKLFEYAQKSPESPDQHPTQREGKQ